MIVLDRTRLTDRLFFPAFPLSRFLLTLAEGTGVKVPA
ncbi:hypothetical protein HRUBRA_02197 [Pseudohaliea rubra DSM 19751]|uniref:Uncharacterized protein n=1 Tax=Pseudohaliea rubra DSM 19751 TaxID=1265313 RepID=A0A095WXB1_9GAMM|nr:hypothetical protein HRUBRA_02197 [Pseudohaliea rubra DSM 19751]